MTYENPWKYNEQDVLEPPENVIGFVYCIENLLTGRLYIGKKKMYNTKTSVKTVTLKNGTKKKKKIKTEISSDWHEYYGSNTELQEDVKKHGVENFRRNILKMCYTLGEMSYWETYEIFVRHAVPSPDYYNAWVSVRVRSNHLPKNFTW
jgi:ribosomal protein L31